MADVESLMVKMMMMMMMMMMKMMMMMMMMMIARSIEENANSILQEIEAGLGLVNAAERC